MAQVTMGKKKVQDAAEKAVQQKEETKVENTVTRQSAGTSQAAPRQRAAASRRLSSARVQQGAWYLQDTDQLAGVTAEASNPELGITGIQVFDPSPAQFDNGTVARITLDTIVGTIKGMQVVESDRDNSLFLRMQSRSWEGDNGQKNYVNDVELSDKAKAQILRYVDSLLEPAQ